MKIGIIGQGVIGTANKNGFKNIGHEVVVHDIKLNTKIQNVLNTEIIYLCLPTEPRENGECNTDIVEDIIDQLNELNYLKPIAIRSTVYPGFTNKMIQKYPNLTIGFVPEFLRERYAQEDFNNNHNLLAIGSNNEKLCNLVKLSHSNLPKNIEVMLPEEAEILKYFNNVYASLRITFANIMYEMALKLGCDYSKIKNAYLKTGKSSGKYLDVNQNLRGFGGMCLPKDTLALTHILKTLGLEFSTIDALLKDNQKYKITVFPGMRK